MKLKVLIETCIRYALGLIMISYGLIKILQLQFLLPEEVLSQTLAELDGVTLTWAFIGYSSWLSVLMGFAELIPGVLLLFKRTKLIGLLLLMPALTVVFLINQAYGFLLHMRIFTGVLMLLGILLLLMNRQPMVHAISNLVQDSTRYPIREFVLNVILILTVLALILIYMY